MDHPEGGRNDTAGRLAWMSEEPDLLAFADAGFIERLKKVGSSTPLKGLQQVHPGWILEKMEDESPLVLGILCRFLPGDKVKYIIEHLPPSKRKLMPKLNDSYRVPSRIAEIVREGVEKKFAYEIPEQAGSSFSLPHIGLMKADDLQTLLRDLGLEEIRKAFKDADPHVLKAFLTRFTPKVAKEIKERIEYGGKVSSEVRQEAQRHLVTLPLEKLPVERLFVEIGYSVLARALIPTDFSWAELVYQKLSPDEGYRLKRTMHETARNQSAAVAQERKNQILARISAITEKGLIRRYWKGK